MQQGNAITKAILLKDLAVVLLLYISHDNLLHILSRKNGLVWRKMSKEKRTRKKKEKKKRKRKRKEKYRRAQLLKEHLPCACGSRPFEKGLRTR